MNSNKVIQKREKIESDVKENSKTTKRELSKIINYEKKLIKKIKNQYL